MEKGKHNIKIYYVRKKYEMYKMWNGFKRR